MFIGPFRARRAQGCGPCEAPMTDRSGAEAEEGHVRSSAWGLALRGRTRWGGGPSWSRGPCGQELQAIRKTGGRARLNLQDTVRSLRCSLETTTKSWGGRTRAVTAHASAGFGGSGDMPVGICQTPGLRRDPRGERQSAIKPPCGLSVMGSPRTPARC